jgi:hypothetical protein
MPMARGSKFAQYAMREAKSLECSVITHESVLPKAKKGPTAHDASVADPETVS